MTGYKYEVEGLYGGRKWDHIVTEDTPQAAAQTLRGYNENEPQYPHRVRKVAVKVEDPNEPKTYKIIRNYESEDIENEVVATGLTLEEAQAHCNHPETSSSTAEELEGRTRTAMAGRWFDGWTEE